MNVYGEDNYRLVLQQLLVERRRDEPRIGYQDLARAIDIPKSYLSKVLHGRADLNVDQIFLAAKFFRLHAEERDYLEMLLAYARCKLEDRRQILAERIEQMRRKHLDTSQHLQADISEPSAGIHEYYLDPVHQLVHTALDIPRFQGSLKHLADELGISLGRVQEAVGNLERLGVVERKDDSLVVKKNSLHLPKGSPFYDAWRAQIRLLALQRTQVIAKDQHYSFSVIFSAGTNTDQEIKKHFFEYLKTLEDEVKRASSERVFQINFDVLPWTGA